MRGVKCPICKGRMFATEFAFQRAGARIQKAIMKCDTCNHREVFK